MVILDDCCCCFPLNKGTIAIGAFYLICGVVGSVYLAAYIQAGWVTENEPFLYGRICFCIIQAFLAIFLIVVAVKENAVLLLSWIFVQIPISIIGTVLESMLNIYRGIFPPLELTPIWTTYVIVFVSLDVYFLLVVYSYYQSLRDKQRDSRT